MPNFIVRTLEFDASSALGEADLIPVTIATSAAVPRMGSMEALDCTPAGADLSRAPLPLLLCHDTSRLAVGLVEQLVARGDRVTGLARFGSSAEAQQVRADVIAKIHRSVSVAYVYQDEGRPIEGGLMYRWCPHEVSIVSVPADIGAGFFRSHPGAAPMPTANEPLLTRQQIDAEITGLCTRHLGTAGERLAQDLIGQTATMDAARAAVLEEAARRDLAAGGHLNVRPLGNQAFGSGEDREVIARTLVARLGGQVQGSVISSCDFVGLAARSLELRGERVSVFESRNAILQRALHTTSDFPALLGNAVGRVLHQAFEEAPAALKRVARLNNLPDFRAKTAVRLGASSSLEKVNEHGEFKYGTIEESANTWRLATYGRIIGITRQSMINDDLSGFAGLVAKFGQAAARREADELVSVLTTAPQVDGESLFSTDNKSLITTTLGLGGIGDAVKALRAQRDLDGGFVNHEPAALVVPGALEMSARQLVASITAAQTADVQPFTLSVEVEPRLDAVSATAWYLVARNQSALEYGYLDGEEGVQTEERVGFEVDGVEIKARLDFGCGWVSPIGWVKSTGAGGG